MAEQVILDFIGDPSGLKPVADALTALGKLTEEQQKDFAKANEDFKKRMSDNAKAVDKTVSSLDKMSNGVKSIGTTLAGVGIKEGTEKIKGFSTEVVNAAKVSQTLKQKLIELKKELEGLDENSTKFTEVSIEAAKVSDQIQDINERIRVLSSDTFAIDAVVDGVKGLTAAFTVAQSASALFGKENEDVQKALLKVQAATGLLIGVQEIANQLTGQGAAKLAVLTAAHKIYDFAVGTTTGAIKAMRVALLGLGIGAFVFLIYEAAKALGVFGDSVDADTDKVNQNTEAIEKNNEERRRFGRAQLTVAEITDRLTKGTNTQTIATSELKDALSLLQQELEDFTTDKATKEAESYNQNVDALVTTTGHLTEEQKALNAAFGNTKQNIDEVAAAALAENEQRKQSIALIEAEIKKRTELKEVAPPREKIEPLPTLPIRGIDQIAVDNKMITDEEIQRLEKENLAELERLRKEAEAKELADAEKLAQEKAAIKLQIEQAAFQAIGMILDEAFAQEQQGIQDNLNAELEALNTQQQAILANEGLTASQKEAIQKQFAQKEAEAKRKAWIADQNAKAEQALINGLLSFTTSLATQGVPAGLITGAIGLALAGVEAALIKSKPVPQFELGTSSAPGGMAIVGEAGTELVKEPSGKMWMTPGSATLLDIKKGSQIIPHNKLAQYADMIPSISDSMLQQFEQNRTSTIDYRQMGKSFADELAKNPMLSVSIDKNGVNLLISKGNRRVNYLNSKYKN